MKEFSRAGRSFNGRTADSDSAYRGSNPCLPAIPKNGSQTQVLKSFCESPYAKKRQQLGRVHATFETVSGNMRNPESFTILAPGVDAASNLVNGALERSKEVLVDGAMSSLGVPHFKYKIELLALQRCVLATGYAQKWRCFGQISARLRQEPISRV